MALAVLFLFLPAEPSTARLLLLAAAETGAETGFLNWNLELFSNFEILSQYSKHYKVSSLAVQAQ